MVSEVRRLIFTADDIVDAVVRLGPTLQLDIPPGRLSVKQFGQSGQVTVHVLQPGVGTVTREIDAEKMAVLLMRYCFQLKIPIPRRSKKALLPAKDGLTLEISLETLSQKLRALGAVA